MTKREQVFERSEKTMRIRPNIPYELIDMVLLESSYLDVAIMLHRDWIAVKMIESIGVHNVLLLALQNHKVEVIKFLDKIGSDYKLIKNSSIYNPSLPIVKYLHSKDIRFDSSSMIAAIEAGCPEIVEYLNHIGLECTIDDIERANTSIIMVLYRLRAIDIFGETDKDYLERNLEKIQNEYNNGLLNTEFLMEYACSIGDLEFVKFLYIIGISVTDDAIGYACQEGYLEVVKFLYNNGTEIQSDAMDLAIICGHMDIVKFMIRIANVHCTADAIVMAIEDNQMDIIQLLHNHNPEYMDDAMESAIYNGYTNVVKFLRNNMQIKIPDNAVYTVCQWSHLELLEWFHSIGIECSGGMYIAIENINYDIIRFLHSIGVKVIVTDMDIINKHYDPDFIRFMENIIE